MNLANRITLARIFLVPVIVFFLLVKLDIPPVFIEKFSISYNQIIAALIFVIAASTDSLDGYIARKQKLVTNLGKLLDPLADKLLITSVLVALVDMDKLDAWIVIIIISREFAVTGLRSIALLEGKVIAASAWGKWKTATQIVAIVSLLINNFPFIFLHIPFDQIVSWLAGIITLYSGIDYYAKNSDLLQQSNNHKD